MRSTTITAIAAAMFTLLGLAYHGDAAAVGRDVSYASVGDNTSIPYGWVDFCHRYPGECASDGAAAADVNLTAKSLVEIQKVNAFVNRSIEPVSDMDHWGVVDRWDLPMDGKGDCEDYALLKRKMLIERGFPRQALLVTVVRDELNEGHAILTVKTNAGEFILDNLNDEVKPVDRIAYRLVKRQSQENPNVWVALGPTATMMVASH
jgi:predicted transglutaminase-like cysteine proteinase